MLLEPTRIYVREVLDIMNIVNIKGMANITGGGIKNLTRMKDMKYVLSDPIEPQNVFKQLQSMGEMTPAQMYEVFNMGMGYVIVIDPESRIDFLNTLRGRLQFKEVGHVENGSGIEMPSLGVSYTGYY